MRTGFDAGRPRIDSGRAGGFISDETARRPATRAQIRARDAVNRQSLGPTRNGMSAPPIGAISSSWTQREVHTPPEYALPLRRLRRPANLGDDLEEPIDVGGVEEFVGALRADVGEG